MGSKEKFKLSYIKIGCADGEKEAENENFMDIFYKDNQKYEMLLDKNKFIISGRKGTGKTILAKYFQSINNNNKTIVHYGKLKEISLHEYIDIDKDKTNENTRILFQEFYIYKQYAMTILDNKLPLRRFISKDMKLFDKIKNLIDYFKYLNLYKQLNELYKQYYSDGIYDEKVIKNIQRIVEASTGEISSNMEPGLKVDSSHTSDISQEITLEKKDFSRMLEQFKKLIKSLLNYINVVLIIDDLDEIKLSDTDHTIKFLLNLVMKVNDINMSITKFNKNSKCILLLRSDILKQFSVYSSNIQKIISDSNIELEWFADSSGQELSNMIMYKIKNSCDQKGNLSKLTLSQIRKAIFASNKDMDAFDKIVQYTFGRPRDVITYLDCIISQHPNSHIIKTQLLRESEKTYSNKLFGELKNEMSFTMSRNEIDDIENLLIKFGKRKFEYHELKKYYESHLSEFETIDNFDNTMQYLYELGVIGYFRKSSTNTTIYYWHYRNGGEYLNKDCSIVIHLGLQKALNV